MSAPRKAYSIVTVLAEIAKARPGRYMASDGWLGDAAHAARPSDHNPNKAGVVRAVDITNDPDDHDGNPKNDLPGAWLANKLASMLGKHPAMMSGAYVIFNRKIISFDRLGEGWRDYDGINAHKTHVHLSVSTAAAGYDSRQAWNLFADAVPAKAVSKTPKIDTWIAAQRTAVLRGQDVLEGRTGGPVYEHTVSGVNLGSKALTEAAAARSAARS